jgi:hypothetical protein
LFELGDRLRNRRHLAAVSLHDPEKPLHGRMPAGVNGSPRVPNIVPRIVNDDDWSASLVAKVLKSEIHMRIHPPIANDQQSVRTRYQSIEFCEVGPKWLLLNLRLLAQSGNENGSRYLGKGLSASGPEPKAFWPLVDSRSSTQ